MRKTLGTLFVASTIAAGTAAPVFANETNGYQHISTGNYAAAEREIADQRRLFPHDPDLLINLATVYARTGRVVEARTLFHDVLAHPNEELTLSQTGSRWSHTIAKDALARLDPLIVASIR